MPFHLDPLSRRRFLGSSAVLALSPFLPRSTTAAGPESENWALLSDTHVAADRDFLSRQGVNMADHLERVVAEVLAERDTLAGAIIDGDCAFGDGQPGDYATLLALLAPLREAGLPVHFTLGNHDDRANFSAALGAELPGSAVEGKHCSVLETPLANWILLDSLRYVNKVEGEFGTAQLAWVSRLLEANPEKPAILVGHHYPQAPAADAGAGDAPPRITGLVDTDAFLNTIAAAPAAKAYIYGHSHTWLLKHDGETGLHHVNLPPTAYVFDKTRPNGWVRATVSREGLALELRCLDPSHTQHGERHELAWR